MNDKAFAQPALDLFFDPSELYNTIAQPSRTRKRLTLPDELQAISLLQYHYLAGARRCREFLE
jgi:hypothetical protein